MYSPQTDNKSRKSRLGCGCQFPWCALGLSVSGFPRFILWRKDQLLGRDLETHNETTAVAMQTGGKHASTTIELLLETVFSPRSMPSVYKEDNWGYPVS
jgi:hypothetical protein